MQVPERYYDEIFEFKGQWDMPSRCGLRIITSKDVSSKDVSSKDAEKNKTVVIVTELYQDNPGTSVTAAGKILAEQICRSKNLELDKIMYLECNPGTNSKLSFYDEDFFEVTFQDGKEPVYRQIDAQERKDFKLIDANGS